MENFAIHFSASEIFFGPVLCVLLPQHFVTRLSKKMESTGLLTFTIPLTLSNVFELVSYILNGKLNALWTQRFNFLSSTTFNHSKQPSEKNELDPISRTDSTCLFLSKILRLQIHFSLKRIN